MQTATSALSAGEVSWRLQQQLELGESLDRFGVSVAIDGDTAVVGATADEAPGSAIVYAWSGGTWGVEDVLSAIDPSEGDLFGAAVALDGDVIVVGAPADPAGGSAYVFERTASGWSEPSRLEASGRTSVDAFGNSVAIHGDAVLVGAITDSELFIGAGAAHFFIRDGSSWHTEKLLSGEQESKAFGAAVALTETTLVATARGLGPEDFGAAFVYGRTETGLTDHKRLRGSDTVPGDSFGRSVSISGDSMVIGAPAHPLEGDVVDIHGDLDGAAYAFQRQQDTWREQMLVATPGAYFGASVAVEGELIAVTAPETGAVHLWVLEGDSWVEAQTLTDEDGLPDDGFANSLSISGRTVLVGFPDVVARGFVSVLAQRDGAPCSVGASCASGFCSSEGVCCNEICDNLCASCLAERKASGPDGVCGFVAEDEDPRGACERDAPAECGLTGACDGAGACKKVASGTQCGPATCFGSGDERAERPAPTCTEPGVCGQQVGSPCGGFLCGVDRCLSQCLDDGACDVARGFHCDEGVCKVPQGAACTTPSDCKLGHCVDGVCCESACDGKCQACTASEKGSGVDGECGAVAPELDPEDECIVDETSLSPQARCNDEECGPFRCNGSVCFTACSSSADCQLDFACNRNSGLCESMVLRMTTASCATTRRTSGNECALVGLLCLVAAGRRRRVERRRKPRVPSPSELGVSP